MFQDCVGFIVWCYEAERDGEYVQPLELTITDISRQGQTKADPVVSLTTTEFQFALDSDVLRQVIAILQEMLSRNEGVAE